MDKSEKKDKDDDSLLHEMRERAKEAADYWKENHELAAEDVRFRNSEQWDETELLRRKENRLPIYTFNQSETFIDQIKGDMRQNTPDIKIGAQVTGIEDKITDIAGDNDYQYAQVMEGIIRNITSMSDMETKSDLVGDEQIGHGFGYFRVMTKYADDSSFDQDICIEHCPNPFLVLLDPYHKEITGADSRYGFIFTDIPEDEAEDKYGKDISSYDAVPEALIEPWRTKDCVRIAEYFYREPVKKWLGLMDNDEVLELGRSEKEANKRGEELAQQGRTIKRVRIVNSHKVMWLKASANKIIEKPREIPTKYVPIVLAPGKILNYFGKRIYRGLIRHSKDAFRTYNLWETVAAELVAMQPRSPVIGPYRAFKGLEKYWRNANAENYGYLPYNDIDEETNQPIQRPSREPPPQMPAGVLERIRDARQNMMQTMGIYQAGLGQASNETSGKAILARQREGDVGSYEFPDNMGKAYTQIGRILVDMVPRVIDTDRMVRMLGEDGKEGRVRLNYRLEDGTLVHDLGRAKYDVSVRVGPSYTTQRLEAADSMINFIQAIPNAAPLLADLIAQNMDWPLADEISERLKKALPPGMIDTEGEDGKPAQPPPPDPKAQAEMAKAQATMATAQADVEQAKADTAKAQADTAKAQADTMLAQVKMAELKARLQVVDGQIGNNQNLRNAFAQMMAEYIAASQQRGAAQPDAGDQAATVTGETQ